MKNLSSIVFLLCSGLAFGQLPASGTLTIDDIRTEIGVTEGSLRDLADLAGFAAGAVSISDFYGYQHIPSGPASLYDEEDAVDENNEGATMSSVWQNTQAGHVTLTVTTDSYNGTYAGLITQINQPRYIRIIFTGLDTNSDYRLSGYFKSENALGTTSGQAAIVSFTGGVTATVINSMTYVERGLTKSTGLTTSIEYRLYTANNDTTPGNKIWFDKIKFEKL